MTERTETQLDQERQALKLESDRISGVFERLIARGRLRPRAEQLGEGYLSVVERAASREVTALKLLEVLDIIRARDVAIQAVRATPTGKQIRRDWPRASITPLLYRKTANSGRLVFRRPKVTTLDRWHIFRPCPPGVELGFGQDKHKHPMDFSRVVLLHLAFVGEDLVVGLDANTEAFLYGSEFVCGDRCVRGEAFSEFSYQHEELSPEKLLCVPYRIRNVRYEIQRVMEDLQGAFEVGESFPHSEFLHEHLTRLYHLLRFDDMLKYLRDWAERNGHSLCEICLVVAPDEILFAVPFGFLLDRNGQPLIRHVGGLAVCLSLVAFKYSVYRYHWMCAPHLSSSTPRCAFFGSMGRPPLDTLDIASEAESVALGFGQPQTFIFSDSSNADFGASRRSFLCWHSSAEICWFAGHGLFDLSRGIQVDKLTVPFPIVGILLHDGAITNLDLISSDAWNFVSCWLVVLNSCLLGRPLIVGSNPLGFLSALYTAGAQSIVSALWPIPDEDALRFAKVFSKEVVSKYQRNAFPRASALRDTIVQLWDERPDCSNPFATVPYFLCGLP